MKDLSWWDRFYADMEKGLTNYTRPSDWKERAAKAETRLSKPVRNQREGRTTWSSDND